MFRIIALILIVPTMIALILSIIAGPSTDTQTVNVESTVESYSSNYVVSSEQTNIHENKVEDTYENKVEVTTESIVKDTVDTSMENIEYTKVDIKTMHSDLDANALRAENNYQDMYLEISGYLNTIDSDGSYISITATDDDWDFDSIQCYLTTDEHLDIVMSLKTKEYITIQGQVSSIGELLGYSMNIHNIIYDENKDRSNNSTYEKNIVNNKEYTIVDLDELHNQLSNNALKAETDWRDVNIEVKGKLSIIDSDGEYFSLISPSDEWSFDSLHCSITDKGQLDVIMNLNKGDTITVRGKISNIGELLGYTLDLDEIIKN